MAGRVGQLAQSRPAGFPGIGIAPGMEFDGGHSQGAGRIHGPEVRSDKEGYPDAGISEPVNRIGQPGIVPGQIKPALRGDFLAPFRNQGGLEGPQPAHQIQHVGCQGQLRVQNGLHGSRQPLQVGVADVAPVLSEVGGDSVGSRCLGQPGRLDRIRLVGTAGLPNRRDMINVYVKSNRHCIAPGPGVRLVSQSGWFRPGGSSMRIPLFLLCAAALAACGGPRSAPVEIELSSEQVVRAFMRAVADSNLSRMGDLWGTARGPANVTRYPPQHQRRLAVIQAWLRGGDSIRVVSDLPLSGRAGERQVVIELHRGGCARQVPIVTVQGPRGGWLVSEIDISRAGNPAQPCAGGP